MVASRIELLQGMPVFGALRADTLDFLLADAEAVTRPAGEYFFLEGDLAESMYVIEQGRVDVLKRWQDREWKLNRFDAGQCFGEWPRRQTRQHADDQPALVLCWLGQSESLVPGQGMNQ